MKVIWKKVWRDVTARKGRTVQVVLSIGVGIFATGLTMGLLDIMQDRMGKTWRSANPAHITVGGGVEDGGIGSGASDDTVRAIGKLPGIEGAEGKVNYNLRWKMRLEDPWEPVGLVARTDYDNQTYDKLVLEDGTWPSSRGIAVERGTAGKFDIAINSTIYLEVNERPRAFQVVGQVYDVWADPVVFGADGSFYLTRGELEKIGGPGGYNQIIAALPVYEEELAKQKGVDIADRLDDLGLNASTPQTFDP